MTLLRFDDVSCERGGRHLFEQMSFEVRGGDAALISGPNGAGKSSLLRVAAGLLEAASGTVTRNGSVAFADESTALDREAPLAEALGFWAHLDGGSKRLPGAMDALGIVHLAPVPVRMLSTGQRKRAALARVVASGASIWLLDEPTNGLDAKAIERLESVCAEHQAEGGLILAASHQSFRLAHSQQLTVGRTPER